MDWERVTFEEVLNVQEFEDKNFPIPDFHFIDIDIALRYFAMGLIW